MIRLTAVLLAAAGLLAACGRVGPVRAPGPPEAITHPRSYPYDPDAPRAGQAVPGGELRVPQTPIMPR